MVRDGALIGKWVVDPSRSSVELENRSMWGLVRVRGVFGEVSGAGMVSPDGQVSGTFTVVAASIDTKSKKRDAHLRSADFFDSENHPDITFAVEAVRPTGPDVAVVGALTVRDRTRPLSFDVAASAVGDELWLDAEVSVDQADFGLTWNRMGMISMDSALTIHAVLIRC